MDSGAVKGDCDGKVHYHHHHHHHYFIVTGRAAHGRIGRLFQDHLINSSSSSSWIDQSPYAVTNVYDVIVVNNDGDKGEEHRQHHHHQQQESITGHDHRSSSSSSSSSSIITSDHPIAFLWENAPQHNTRAMRDTVACYSHLPFGILLDDKWALARLLGGTAVDGGGSGSGAFKDPNLVTLESHCFRGAEFAKFAKRVGLLPTSPHLHLDESSCTSRQNQAALASGAASARATNYLTSTAASLAGIEHDRLMPRYQFEDLILRSTSCNKSSSSTSSSLLPPPPSPTNLWVIKDAMSNGAGGIWIVDETNVHDFFLTESEQHQDVVDDINSRVNKIDGNNHIKSCNDDTITSSNCAVVTKTSSPSSTVPLHPTHRYVAQRYAWPPTLYNGRKCHLRVYALITCTGEAFVHRKAFLHVANELFTFTGDNDDGISNEHKVCGGEQEMSGKTVFHPSVHITNCCANSHDASKFAGEICVDLEKMSEEWHDDGNVRNNDDGHTTTQDPLPLGDYLPSISASVAALAQSFLPFLRGGESNCGFEYLGLDFVLSSVEGAGDVDYADQRDVPHELTEVSTATRNPEIDVSLHSTLSSKIETSRRRPVAYLLEVNAPPSQDTATGLQHAEDLHDEVIADLLRLWVLPNVDPTWSLNRSRESESTSNGDEDKIDHRCCGGWRCVYPLRSTTADGGSHVTMKKVQKSEMILPSKAAILNRIRWALFERKAMKESELMWNSDIGCKCNNVSNKDSDENNTNIYCGFDSRASNKNAANADTDDIDANVCGGNSSISSVQPPLTSLSPDDSSRRWWWWKNVSDDHLDGFVTFARSQFSYFSHNYPATRGTSSSSSVIFFESGGGAQVPQVVQNAVTWSLSNRDRSVVGARLQIEARLALTSLLVQEKTQPCREDDPSLDSRMIIMGTNATLLLAEVARKMQELKMIGPGDEIIISSENHQANVTPWLKTARLAGANVKWWTVAGDTNAGSNIDDLIHNSSSILSDLVTERTKVVAMSHVSNVLGIERDISSVCELVHRMTKGRGQVVVDGVAAAPHLLESDATSTERKPDWYVVSLHKLFGPHLGCLICKRSVVKMLHHFDNDIICGGDLMAGTPGLLDEKLARYWELGTLNYEACCGAIALHTYFVTIGINAWKNEGTYGVKCDDDGGGRGITSSSQPSYQTTSESSNDHCGEAEVNLPTSNPNSFYVNIARMYIYHVENRLLGRLIGYLQSCAPKIRIVQDAGEMRVAIDSAKRTHQNLNPRRIPIVCFLHSKIPSHRIVKHCREHEVVCRACKFLSTDRLWNELGIERNVDVVRFSLAHYNTLEEIDRSIHVLESLDGWN